jgi:hypothetical protein
MQERNEEPVKWFGNRSEADKTHSSKQGKTQLITTDPNQTHDGLISIQRHFI